MSADWNTPSLSTAYATLLATLKDRDVDLATQFNNGTATNVPTGAIKLDASNTTCTYRKWNGSAWVDAFSAMYLNNLQVNGLLYAGAITTGINVSTGDSLIELGGSRTGDGNSYIDFHSQTGTDFDFRIIRYPGANGGVDLVNNGTGDMKVSQNNAGSVLFLTGGAEKMRLHSNGYVGVGTSSPAYPLDVQSSTCSYVLNLQNSLSETSIRFNNTGANGRSYVMGTGSTGGAFANGGFGIWDGGSSSLRFIIDNVGNVGIGTGGPGAKLGVLSSVNNWAMRVATTYGTNDSGFYFDSSGNSQAVLRDGAGNLSYLTNNGSNLVMITSSVERARIDSLGNLGIGTSAPAFKLDVVSGTSPINVQGNGLGAGIRLFNTVAARDFRILQKDGGYLAITDETAGAERMYISADGTAAFNGALKVRNSQLVAARLDGKGSAGITFSTAAPSGGADGDMWFQYA